MSSANGLDEPTELAIRSNTLRGRPLAGDKWIAKLEAKLNRRLRSAPNGRPRKAKAGK